MMDFFRVVCNKTKNGHEVTPRFVMTQSKDLMVRGGDFYAVWIEEKGLWSTNEQDVIDMIDKALYHYVNTENLAEKGSLKVDYMWDAASGSIDRWHKYCQKQCRDNYHMLDETLIFSNTITTKEDYASKKLPYPLEPCDISGYETLMSVLYSPEEREKIEWAIGSIVCGASKELQKFMVLYGSAGTGKSTILNIIQKLFDGYYSVFDAKALGSANNSFALEAFKTNPLVAIQHDGDLSRIEDNTRLNSLVSHELMTVNEKFKSAYTNSFKAFLFMGTNKPVKITDAKSGLIRRLIDVHPTGEKLGFQEYMDAMKHIDFELGGIAYHCKEVYLSNPNLYDNYVPVLMMDASNDFYNFVQDCYFEFKKSDGVTLKDGWEMYKAYCDEAKISYPLPKRSFKEELKNYFREYYERTDDSSRKRNYYSGFIFEKFDYNPEKTKNEHIQQPKLIEFNCEKSLFDDLYSDLPAQYASNRETPLKKWSDVKTKLSDINTNELHYVKVPENHIVIDFDIPNESGNKCYEKNLQAASKFPATYAELSKSGAGIHLHYIYTGDVSKLNRLYSDHIEVKVFNGNSSLRRKLTKCNDIPIATISGGLPTKGEKMINPEVVTTEKGIRTSIKKNLCKEVHPGTKPSVDFIFKILEDAYTSGIHYDVTDMRPAILAFAANSTNQADYCIKLVNKMHFKSEEPAPAVESKNDFLVFYDIEVFPNLFIVNWKAEGKNTSVVRMINPGRDDIAKLLNYKLVGFNCRRYDNHILYARLQGYSNEELYRLSQRIINGSPNCFFSEAYNISYTDVYDFASAGNKKSLKKLEIEMSAKANNPKSKMSDDLREMLQTIKHHELGLAWDQPVPKELWEKVAEYCDDDVIATEAAFNYLSADWTARQILADLAEMTVNDTTNTLTTRIIFGKNRSPQSQFMWRDLAEPVTELSEEVYSFLADAAPEMMEKTHGEAGSYLPYFPGYKYEGGHNIYRGEDVGKGGYVYSEPGMYGNVALLDVSSMHPHSVIAECLFGPEFTARFKSIVDGRVDIKHEEWDILNTILDGKLTKFVEQVKNGEMKSKDLANGLKTAINSVYGLTSAGFENAFKDPRNVNNIVALRGALFMVDLKHAVQEKGFTVAHIKTDSIKIPDATPEIIDFVMKFGKEYGYSFEHEATYDRMTLVNKSTYIAKYMSPSDCQAIYGYAPKDNLEHEDNPWTATGDQFKVPYVFKTLFSQEPILFDDMCETFAVTSTLDLDMNEDLPDVSSYEKELQKLESDYKKGKISDTMFEPAAKELVEKIKPGHNYQFVGKVGQFCPIKPGCGGGILMREKNGKHYAANDTTGFRWLESAMVRELHKENDIDRSYYDRLVTEAVHDIGEYGDFEWFVSDDPYIPKSKTPDFMNIPENSPEYIPFA